MPDEHYENPKLARIYDLSSGWSQDRDFYLHLASTATPQNILGLGCGTGLICNAYASKGHNVTGVDPAPAMLDVARRSPQGNNIEWTLSTAQNYSSSKRFDLAIMTGHAFQVLLEDQDVLQTFAMVAQHLAPQGRFVFESRNPAIDWATKWHNTTTLTTPTGVVVHEERQMLQRSATQLSFDTHYHFPEETIVSHSVLRFLSHREITHHLQASGLRVEKLLGDWDG